MNTTFLSFEMALKVTTSSLLCWCLRKLIESLVENGWNVYIISDFLSKPIINDKFFLILKLILMLLCVVHCWHLLSCGLLGTGLKSTAECVASYWKRQSVLLFLFIVCCSIIMPQMFFLVYGLFDTCMAFIGCPEDFEVLLKNTTIQSTLLNWYLLKG